MFPGKIMLSIVLVCLSLMRIEAQNFKFGFVAGFVAANAHSISNPERYTDYRVFYPMAALNVNGLIRYKKSDQNWGFSVEPGLIQKGGLIHILDQKSRFRLNYFQLPVLAEIRLTDQLFLAAGPEFAYLLTSKGIGAFSQFKEKAFEISGMVGLHYRITEALDIGLRYNHAITSNSVLTWSDETGQPVGQSEIYNQYIQLVFRFKK